MCIRDRYDANLKTLMEQTKNDLSVAVEDINTKLDQLSELNSSIAHEIFSNNDYDGVNYGPNDLLDQRNVILDDLSRYGDVQVTDLEDGKIQVKICLLYTSHLQQLNRSRVESSLLITNSSIRFTNTILFSSLKGNVTGLRLRVFAMAAAEGADKAGIPMAPSPPFTRS